MGHFDSKLVKVDCEDNGMERWVEQAEAVLVDAVM